MNRLQADISLLCITLLASIQYIFLKNVPVDISQFAFLCITNLLGFFILLPILRHELCHITKKQLLCSALLSLLLIGFNYFLLLGSQETEATTVSFVVTAYIIFVPIVSLLFRQRIEKKQWLGIMLVLLGLFLTLRVDFSQLFSLHFFYLIAADIFFAVYIVFIGHITFRINPSILVLGELFFSSLFCLFAWMLQTHSLQLVIPTDTAFWTSALFIAFFIRAFYSLIQVHAQRCLSAVQVSLVFSTEIIFSLFLSPLFALFLHGVPEKITIFKVAGCITILLGVLTADHSLSTLFSKKTETAQTKPVFHTRKSACSSFFISFLGYLFVTIPFLGTDFLGRGLYAGPESGYLTVIGLLFGYWGYLGSLLGGICVLLVWSPTVFTMGYVLVHITLACLVPYLLWHVLSPAVQISFSHLPELLKYAILCLGTAIANGFLFMLCFKNTTAALESTFFFFFWCVAFGIPFIILFRSMFRRKEH